MSKFYFTYGTDGTYPFNGGYSVVDAEDREQAIAVFRAYHPDKIRGIVNCAEIYTEDYFARVFHDGRILGEGCHEEIAPLASAADIMRDMINELRLRCRKEAGREMTGVIERISGALNFALMVGCVTDKEFVQFEAEINEILRLYRKRAARIC